jgi:Zn-dependent protease with chaperone function
MIRPLDSRFEARYYDGHAPVRQPAIVDLDGEGLNISVAGRDSMVWKYAGLSIAADGSYGEPIRMERTSGESLIVENTDFMEAMRQHGGAQRPAIQFDLRGWPAVLFCCIAIAIIASVLYVWGVRFAADQAARFTPAFVDDRIGLAVSAILAPEQSRCTNAVARQRLQPIVDRLAAAAGTKLQFHVIYVNQGVINAFAAPGGYIVVYRGLLDEAETAEEFAGVLAHEMQHVIKRHSTRAIAREFSGRALLSLMAVDSSGTPAAIQASARLANLSYQRADEEEADLGAVALLARARIKTDGLTSFLRRLLTSSMGAASLKYLSTHPAMNERVEELQEESRKVTAPASPLMTVDEWYRARAVCADK